MDSNTNKRWAFLYSLVILGGTLLLAYLNFNQFYQAIILQQWEGVPFSEAGRWFYRSPVVFGYYSLVKSILYFLLFLISLFACIRRKYQLLQTAGTIFLGLYLFTYLLQLF